MQKNFKSMYDAGEEKSFFHYITKAFAAAGRITDKKNPAADEDYTILKLNLLRAYKINPHNKMVQDLMNKFNTDIKMLENFARQHYSSQANDLHQSSAHHDQPPAQSGRSSLRHRRQPPIRNHRR